MVSRVSLRLAPHGEKLRLADGIDSTLFLEFSDTGVNGVFIIVDMTAREGVLAVEGLLLPGDEEHLEVSSVFLLLEHDGVSGCTRDEPTVLLKGEGSAEEV